ncbi:MAG: TIGR01459 family HAD-type hydrolase, partial [Planctomycetota bacterium]
VLVLSNSGRRSADNVRRLAELGLPAAEHDGVITSGEVVWHGLRERTQSPFNELGKRCYLITRGSEADMIAGLNVSVSDSATAEFVWLAGLEDDRADLAYWRADLARCVARKLPMLCANPDLTMFTPHGLRPAPGALAQLYADLGGQVDYVGKPHAAIFAAALRQLGNPAPERVLVIGDSLDHDVFGGRRADMLTALITDGIHATALAGNGDLGRAVAALAKDPMHTPHWAMTRLVWE